MSPDLWGSLPLPEKIKTPYTILQEQAEFLSDKTNGILAGYIRRGDPQKRYGVLESTVAERDYFSIFFSISSTAIPIIFIPF